MSTPSPTNRDAALHVLRVLREAGHTAYFAGGCVRDQLLGLTPKDHDIATSAPPAEVRRVFRNTQSVGAAFGVILVRMYGHQIEVATFRSDGHYSDGRRPDQVRFATPEEDARRRDFTINGLFLDPLAHPPQGELIDFVGGADDLRHRILRAIGDPEHRFSEDHLRMLRAVRFAARFGLTIDPPTAAAIRAHAPQLRRIAPERVGDEVRRILTDPSRTTGWNLLRSLGLTTELFRYVACAEVQSVSLVRHLPTDGDAAGSFLLSLAAGLLEETTPSSSTPPPSGREQAFHSVLTPDAITAAVAALRRTLRLSNDESDELAGILRWTRDLTFPAAPTLAQRRRFLASPVSAPTLLLLQTLPAAGLFAERCAALLPDLHRLLPQDNAPPPLLTGDHLTAAGLKPGPLFRKLLEATYDQQLEGHLTTPEEALRYALASQRTAS